MEKQLHEILNYSFKLGKHAHISVQTVLLTIAALMLTAFILKVIRRYIVKKSSKDDKTKFVTIFNYLKWIFYTIIILRALHNSGVNLNAVFTASAALLIGVGLALQTFFQDIISGVFILTDRSVQVGDIIQIGNNIGKVDQIQLRTTRAITFDNKVLIIPNHLYLTKIQYNWSKDGTETRESIEIGVAYGSDTELVKRILLAIAYSHSEVYHHPAPMVLFTDFGDNAMQFKLTFTVRDSFVSTIPKSDMRFEIDKEFRKHGIEIPFPQRSIHMVTK